MRIKNHILILLGLIIIGSCTNTNTEDQTEQAAPELKSGELFLTAAQFDYADITFGSIESQLLSSGVNARGELVLPVNAKADLVSLYAGVVETIAVREGDKISKGQVLAVLNSPEFIGAQQRYLMVKNQLVMLEQEYTRQKELNEDKITSDKYYQKALADYNVAAAEFSGLGLQLKMAGVDMSSLEDGKITAALKIVSPMSGHIENIDANPGKYIMQDERLMQVINRDQLFIELNVFEKDIMKVSPGQRVSFTLSNLGKEGYDARIISVGNMVREENRVVKVLAEFKNEHGRMLPGMFVAAEIHSGEAEVETLPEEAVVRMGNQDYVIFYTIPDMKSDKGTSFLSVPVRTGYSQRGLVEVTLLEKIPDDALIVVTGGYFLKTEMAKQAE